MTVTKITYGRALKIVAGLGGLLYGIDVGIIAGALPYLEATSGLSPQQLSYIVAAVLLGSVLSTLVAGVLADRYGRRSMMIVSGLLFAVSIPVISLAHGYWPLFGGRLLQGISAGLIGVVVPLYLAECLEAKQRGSGTGIFQWMLTLGIVAAAIIGYCLSLWVAQVEKVQDMGRLLAFKDTAWRSIFWVSLPPGLLFSLGSMWVSESPRWLFRRGRIEAARFALRRSRMDADVELEMIEMAEAVRSEQSVKGQGGEQSSQSLFSRRYVIPFVLACAILACNQTTGINSVIGYNATILIQAGLTDAHAHLGYLILTLVNFAFTAVGVFLVDKIGRKPLLLIGTAGVVVSLAVTGFIFKNNEGKSIDVKPDLQSLVEPSTGVGGIKLNHDQLQKLFAAKFPQQPSVLTLTYSCGDFTADPGAIRSDDTRAGIEMSRVSCLPRNRVLSFFQNPWGDYESSKSAPVKIDSARLAAVPPERSGWRTALWIFCFMAFFGIGPGVCVWLALSELMPTRIRSNGMSVALLINQSISTVIAAGFLPTVTRQGYSTVFFAFALCTVFYFIVVLLFLPETKGRTLEEIEEIFKGTKAAHHRTVEGSTPLKKTGSEF